MDTRLRDASISFHLIFEWLAAALLAVTIGVKDPAGALLLALGSYLAFISLYEIGYLVNDLFAAKKEAEGRKRGPQGASVWWIGLWVGVRLFAFVSIATLMEYLVSPEWWSYFLALILVFALHNLLQDKEMKAATFLWLAWLRFMAPIVFVIEERLLVGVGLAAAVSYVAFRMFGYLDSKGLLRMPGRQRPSFRLLFLVMPLVGAIVLWPYSSARGYIILSFYFALAAMLGTLVQVIPRKTTV